jgi:hypothetical protein
MRLPGFTAEAALGQTGGRRHLVTKEVPSRYATVVPQGAISAISPISCTLAWWLCQWGDVDSCGYWIKHCVIPIPLPF